MVRTNSDKFSKYIFMLTFTNKIYNHARGLTSDIYSYCPRIISTKVPTRPYYPISIRHLTFETRLLLDGPLPWQVLCLAMTFRKMDIIVPTATYTVYNTQCILICYTKNHYHLSIRNHTTLN
jgi:hypothetical protein